MPQDRETGYIDDLECECVQCDECEGQGGHHVRYVLNQRNHYEALVEPQWFACSACNGTGVNSNLCECDHSKEVVA